MPLVVQDAHPIVLCWEQDNYNNKSASKTKINTNYKNQDAYYDFRHFTLIPALFTIPFILCLIQIHIV